MAPTRRRPSGHPGRPRSWRCRRMRASLQKSHNPAVGLSQTASTMWSVHAAPVRYLPPPGASPAAGEHSPEAIRGASRRYPSATLVPVASDRSLRLRTRVTLFFALIALFAGLVLIGVTYGFARNNLLDERTASAKQQAFDNAAAVADQLDAALVDPSVSIGDYFENVLRTEPGGFAVLSSTSPDGSGDPDRPDSPHLGFPRRTRRPCALRRVGSRVREHRRRRLCDRRRLHHPPRHRLLRGVSRRQRGIDARRVVDRPRTRRPRHARGGHPVRLLDQPTTAPPAQPRRRRRRGHRLRWARHATRR